MFPGLFFLYLFNGDSHVCGVSIVIIVNNMSDVSNMSDVNKMSDVMTFIRRLIIRL